MELATIFLIWLAITVIDNLSKRKKRRLPAPENSSNFDIPTLANETNFPGEEIPIFIESPRQAEVRPQKFSAQIQSPKIPKKRAPENVEEPNLNLTPSDVMNAFVLSEILGKPKALRRYS